MGNAVVIKNGRARLIDPKTGADRGSVGSANPVAAASDGQYIVIAYAEGYARRYCAATGAERGSVGEPNVSGCSISGGVIILTYAPWRCAPVRRRVWCWARVSLRIPTPGQ